MAVAITTSGTAHINKAGHSIVRKNSTTLYAVIEDATPVGGFLPGFGIWKSTQNGAAGSWTRVAVVQPPASITVDSYIAPSCCIDNAGFIRVAYLFVVKSPVMGSPVTDLRLRYLEFDTSTDTVQNDQNVETLNIATIYYYTDCAIALTGNFQVAYSNAYTSRVGNLQGVFYRNFNGLAWSATINVFGAGIEDAYPSICIEGQSTALPMIAVLITPNALAGTLGVAQGNAANATAFTIKRPATAGSISSNPRLCQDALGDEVVAFTGTVNPFTEICGAPHPVFAKKLHSAAWSTTWGEISLGCTATAGNTCMVTRGYRKCYNDENLFVALTTPAVNRYNSYADFTNSQFALTTMPNMPAGALVIRTRWANYNEPAQHNHVDMLIEDVNSSGNVYYDFIDLNIPS